MVNNIDKKLSDIIKNYSDDVKKSIEKRIDKTANEILIYIKDNAPRSTNLSHHLADSFIATKRGSDVNKITYISSKTKSGLVHLVEMGFKHRSGKFVAARPFLRPAFDEFTPEMLYEIREIIKRGE